MKMQEDKLQEQQKKEQSQHNDRKIKYDLIVAKNIPDKKLTITQLKSLFAFKKRKADKTISSLPKHDLLQLWKEWKHQVVEPAFQNDDLIQSVGIAII